MATWFYMVLICFDGSLIVWSKDRGKGVLTPSSIDLFTS